MKTIGVNMNEEFFEKIKAFAKSKQLGVGGFFRLAVTEYMEREDKK